MRCSGCLTTLPIVQLRKQHRLLAMRYHPDAAARNNIDLEEATKRFHAMQTAYEVLSDPKKRRRYNLELRLQHRRAWLRAWGGAAAAAHRRERRRRRRRPCASGRRGGVVNVVAAPASVPRCSAAAAGSSAGIQPACRRRRQR